MIIPATNHYLLNLKFRLQDESNYWLFGIEQDGTSSAYWQLNKISSGVESAVGGSTMSFTAGDVYTLRVVISGNLIKVYINNVLKFSTTNSLYNGSTKIAIEEATNTGYYVNVKVDNVIII